MHTVYCTGSQHDLSGNQQREMFINSIMRELSNINDLNTVAILRGKSTEKETQQAK